MKTIQNNNIKCCPLCGGALRRKKHGDAYQKVCASCGFVMYINSAPTASAIITNKKKQVLLTKRGIEPAIGTWDFPGGFLNNGEDPVRGLRREIREELGVTLDVKRIVGIYIDRYYYQRWMYTFNVDYECTIKSGTLKPMDDVSDARWFDQSKIPWSQLAFTHLKRGLKDWIALSK